MSLSKKELLGFEEPFELLMPKQEAGSPPLPNFEDLYSLASHCFWVCDETVYGAQAKWVFGDSASPRTCSICDLNAQQGATFKSVAHVVPENLGNKRIETLEECDVCNGKYSNCEEELGAMLEVERLFVGARRKKGGGVEINVSPALTLKSEGVGKIRAEIDKANNPIKDITEKAFELPVIPVEFWPVLAIRSLARSAWFIISKEHRVEHPQLKDFAKGIGVELPFEIIKTFSPGVPKAMGRFRVWTLKKPESKWSPVVLSLALSNTTIIWRMSNEGGVSAGPLPPIPIYDNKASIEITSYLVKANEKVSAGSSLQVSFESKVAGVPTETKKSLASAALIGLMESKSVEVAIAANENAVKNWLPGILQIKKLSNDLSRFENTVLRLPDYGVRLNINATGDKRAMSFNFQGNDLPVSNALRGIQFSIAFANAGDGENLLIRFPDQLVSIPLTTQPASSVDYSNFEKIRAKLQSLNDAGEVLGIDPVVGSTGQDEMRLISIIGAANGAIALPKSFEVNVILPRVGYDDLRTKTQSTEVIFDYSSYPIAGVPELTEEKVGPCQFMLVIQNPSLDLEVISENETEVEFTAPKSKKLLIFRKRLKIKKQED